MLKNIQRQYSGFDKIAAEVITGVEIGETYNPYGRANEYAVYVSFMHGDGDSYETEECSFVKGDEENLLAFLNFLCLCAVRKTGRGRDSYDDIEGYSRWVEDADIDEWDDEGNERTEEEMEALREYQILTWPFWEGEWCATFNAAHVVFFDENGTQKAVRMSTEKCQTEKA